MTPKTNDQPLAGLVWIPRDHLTANDYNPNKVAPPELRLLKISILENGWTQPIVARPTSDTTAEIVDGYHRWTLSADPEIAALTNGLVPVVYLDTNLDPATQRMATIRHNRARGAHHVVKMADIVNELATYGLPNEDIALRLQMDTEEVNRLLLRGNKLVLGPDGHGFNKGWKPTRTPNK